MTGIPPWIDAAIAAVTAICKAMSAWTLRHRRRQAETLALEQCAKEAAPNVPWGMPVGVACALIAVVGMTSALLILKAGGE